MLSFRLIYLLGPVLLALGCPQPVPEPAPKPVGPKVLSEAPEVRLMRVLDASGDGYLGPLEFRSLGKGVDMGTADLDSDGYISAAELRTVLLAKTPLKKNHRGQGKFARPSDPDHREAPSE